VPLEQLLHVVAAALEYVPATQLVQLAEVVAPIDGWYVPPAQLVQTLAPAADAYFPAAQLAQLATPVASETVPAGHDEQLAAAAPE
jgi:lipoprotein-anchoring transpeptidase ErfK/SrfK